jgi:sulfur-oxidizing protein SoxZ
VTVLASDWPADAFQATSREEAVVTLFGGEPEEGGQVQWESRGRFRRGGEMAGQQEHKLNARIKDGMAEGKLLLRHPMETGNRKEPSTGIKVPRHFIRERICEHNGSPVLRTQWSGGMARNPCLSIRIREAKTGDRVRIQWTDDRGETDANEAVVS